MRYIWASTIFKYWLWFAFRFAECGLAFLIIFWEAYTFFAHADIISRVEEAVIARLVFCGLFLFSEDIADTHLILFL
jgi:hypothetical protein